MTQVASLTVPSGGALADPRGPVGEPDEVAGGGQFDHIFETLGAESSETDSLPSPKAEAKVAGPKSTTGASAGSPASGLHRLLASGRLASAGAAPADTSKTDPVIAIEDGAPGAEPADPLADGEMKASRKPAETDPLAAVLASSQPASSDAVPANAMPMVAPVPAASVRDEAANEPRPAAKGARGVVLVTREADDGGAAPPVRVPVTIESLETHFAPVETVNASVAEAASAGALPARPAIPDRTGSGRAGVQPIANGKGAAAAAKVTAPVADDDAASADAIPATAPERPERSDPRQPVAAVADKIEKGAQAAKAEPAALPAGPVTTLPPATLKQVGDAIVDAARDTETAAATPASTAAETSSRAVVKVLTVRLDPPEYGSLAVRLTLQDGALSVQIRAERETTAAALDHDREKLVEHLKASGYGTDATMIDTRRELAVMRSDGTAGANAGGSGSAGGSAAGSGGGPAAGGGMARRDGSGEGQGFPRERGEGRDGATVPDTGAGNLYV